MSKPLRILIWKLEESINNAEEARNKVERTSVAACMYADIHTVQIAEYEILLNKLRNRRN